MADRKIDGLGVALVTPFKEDLTIDYDSLGKLIEHVISGGCDYIVALGTTAETPTLTHQEKIEVSDFIIKSVKRRIPVVIGIGGNSTISVADEIRNWDLSGFDAILSVTPFYNKPSQKGLYLHFKTICDASPIPIILYNVPGRTGINLSAHTTLELAAYNEKIIGIKEASGKFDQSLEIIEKSPESFSLISGNDSETFRLMEAGANGVVSVLANALPKEMKRLVTLCKENKFQEAEILQESLRSLTGRLFEDGSPSGVKALLAHMGLVENILRLPLVPVNKQTEEAIIKEYGDLLK